MSPHYLSGLLVFSALFLLEVSCRPSNNESATPLISEEPTFSNGERALKDEEEKTLPIDDNIKDILDKISMVNAGLKKPNRRQQIKYNTESPNIGGYVLNRDILEKLQQIIASGKIHPLLESENYQENNNLDVDSQRYSRKMPYYPNDIIGNQIGASVTQLPYLTAMPVLVMPSANTNNPLGNFENDYNHMESISQYQTRQRPQLIPFQWPLAQYFPILIKDPLLGFLQGGQGGLNWGNFFETGQTADVCSRKQKSSDQANDELEQDTLKNSIEIDTDGPNSEVINSRGGRALKKRNISTPTKVEDDLKTLKKMEKFFTKLNSTQKPTKIKPVASVEKNTKNHDEDDGALRFGTFSFFGDKKPIAPPPGFFINKLKVRRGGVAIAGPGGVATAGRGGTAIVGPGGLAYTQPGGLAVAGPAARVVALSPETNLASIVSRLQALSATDGSVPRFLKAIPEGKVVATGPVIYYHSGSVEYLPFYGGGKGMYLEIKTDSTGRIISEVVVSEDKISMDNVMKNNDENLLAKVLAANLQKLRTLSGNALKLHNLGRRTGSLDNADKERFKSQLEKLGETASNTIKLIEEVSDNIDVLFKSNPKLRQYEEYEEDEVNDESIGIEAPNGDDASGISEGILGGATIAEAKPVGLAVIGENGLAASRPIGTAVAVSGVAIARPIATAIAGVDPAALGINLSINHSKNK